MLACGRRLRIQRKLSKAGPDDFRERDIWCQCAERVRAQLRRVIERAERGRDDGARNPCMVVSDRNNTYWYTRRAGYTRAGDHDDPSTLGYSE